MGATYLLSPTQVAARLGVSVRRAQDLKREIGHVRIGKLIRFDPADVTAYEQRQRRAPVPTIAPAPTRQQRATSGAVRIGAITGQPMPEWTAS